MRPDRARSWVPFRTGRGHGFRSVSGEVMGSGCGTHDLGLVRTEPIASGAPGRGQAWVTHSLSWVTSAGTSGAMGVTFNEVTPAALKAAMRSRT